MHPHDVGHHHAHHARDEVAVTAALLERLVALPHDVHPVAVEVVEGVAVGDVVAADRLLEGGERRLLNGLAGEGAARLALQGGEPLGGRLGRGASCAEAQNLLVDAVVAVAAPGVEEERAFPCRGGEEAGRSREALRAASDLRPASRDEWVHGSPSNCVPPRRDRPSISPAVALADPTTPGTPAPGCVPAPTK